MIHTGQDGARDPRTYAPDRLSVIRRLHRLRRCRKINWGVPGRTRPDYHPQITQITEDYFMGPRKDEPRVLSADYADCAD